MLQFRFSWNLVSCCVSRRHGQRSNVLAVFISLSGSKMCPCFALLFFTIKFNFKFKVHAKYIDENIISSVAYLVDILI